TSLQVLPVGAQMVVLGEVAEDDTGGSRVAASNVVLQKATPRSILDIKTTSILRPFTVSTKTEQELIQEIERSARYYFWGAMLSIASGLVLIVAG
ncbi:unnamed protein product, partial [Discosporangium mesarthrocarpum]